MPTQIENISLHHSGGVVADYYASSKNITLGQIEAGHKARWPDFYSKLRPDLHVGYNFVIFADGSFVQTRYIGEETAAQRGSNRDTVSFMLAGNFSLHNGEPVEIPGRAEINTLCSLMLTIINKDYAKFDMKILPGADVDVKFQNIHPHRFYQTGTECFGTFLPDNWGQQLIIDYYTAQLSFLQQLILKLKMLHPFQSLSMAVARAGFKFGAKPDECLVYAKD